MSSARSTWPRRCRARSASARSAALVLWESRLVAASARSVRPLIWFSPASYAACAKCATSPAKNPRPSVEPIADSTWFSGCGINPSTLSFSESTPAMALVEPLTFHASLREPSGAVRSEEHTSELQSHVNLVCRLLLEKKKKKKLSPINKKKKKKKTKKKNKKKKK